MITYKVVEHVSKNKEEVKSEIQNIFAKIKDAISSREEEILSEIDKEFEITFFSLFGLSLGDKKNYFFNYPIHLLLLVSLERLMKV